MAYGTLKADVIQSDTAGVAPQFNDGNGTQTGTLCRAWVYYKGTATVGVQGSFNVSSVTYVSTGVYTINMTTALSSATYAVTTGVSGNGSSGSILIVDDPSTSTYSTTQFTVRSRGNTGGTSVDDFVHVAVFR